MPFKVETIVFSYMPPPYGEPFEDDKRAEALLNQMEAEHFELKAVIPNSHGVQCYWWHDK